MQDDPVRAHAGVLFHAHVGRLAQLRQIVRRNVLGAVDFALHQGQLLRRALANDLPDIAVEVPLLGPAFPVVRIRKKLVLRPILPVVRVDLERAGARAVIDQPRLPVVARIVGLHDRGVHDHQVRQRTVEQRERLQELDAQRVRIHNGHASLVHDGQPHPSRSLLDPEDPVEGVLDRLGGDWSPILELRAQVQLEGPLSRIRRRGGARGKMGQHLVPVIHEERIVQCDQCRGGEHTHGGDGRIDVWHILIGGEDQDRPLLDSSGGRREPHEAHHYDQAQNQES